MNLRERIAGLIVGRNVADPPLDKSIEPQIVASSGNSVPLPAITRNSDTWGALVEMVGKLPAPTERTALAVSAIYASVNLIAGAVAALPINIYRVNTENGDRKRIHNDSLHWVFNEQMSPRWMATSGWEFLVQSLLLHGDGFAIIDRGPKGAPIGLTPVHPLRVTVGVWPDGSRLAYAIEPEVIAGKKESGFRVYDQDDIVHIPGFGFDGLRGLSPLRYALRIVGASSIAMQEFSANFFANSARPDYALKTDTKLTRQAVDELRDQIDEVHKGVENSHRPMLLHSGLDIKTITMPMKDMELVAMRQFQIEEIARIYGVPPFMIGHNEKTTSWGSGVEAMSVGFVRFTLRQHLKKIQSEINRKLFLTASREVEFDTADLERADTKSLFEALRIGVGRAGEPKIMSVNEARARLRLNRVDDGDSMTINPASSTSPQKEPAP